MPLIIKIIAAKIPKIALVSMQLFYNKKTGLGNPAFSISFYD